MYYRRWTRMFLRPGFKYFSSYGVLSNSFDRLTPLLSREAPPTDHYKAEPRKKKYEVDLQNKLIERLFLRYPDLKYEPISKKKYPGTPLNSFSYAYAFLIEQKKLIKSGYTIQKSFEIVEKRFQEKMQRKIDQTLLSRGLAIGNRARSILTLYQQQAEYESRLKTERTERELEKYLIKEKRVQDKVEGDSLFQNEPLSYSRIFQTVVDQQEQTERTTIKKQGAERYKQIDELQGKFKNLFKQFYERAAAKDRLEGLTDAEMIESIRNSPNRVKKQTREVMKFLQGMNVKLQIHKGQVRATGNVPDWLKTFIRTPEVHLALLNEQLNYERPSANNSINIKHDRQKLYEAKAKELTSEEQDIIKMNKRKQFQYVAHEEIPYSKGAYKLFQSNQERLLRLEIKYYDMLFRELKKRQGQSDVQREKEGEEEHFAELEQITMSRDQAIDKFRRLKFRLENRHREISREELLFSEHQAIRERLNMEDGAEFEELISYLKKKTQDRRLTSLGQANDNRINKYLEEIPVSEKPQAHGDTKVKY